MTRRSAVRGQRTDVLVYQTEVLDRDAIVAGPITMDLKVSTSGTDSDFIVKLIDVYPNDFPTTAPPGRQQPPCVPRSEDGWISAAGAGRAVSREITARASKSPNRSCAGEPTTITYELPDVSHAFRSGHRVMVQVQSSWFPLIDRNPQVFMDIPAATPSDFHKATERVYRSGAQASGITVMVQAR